MLIHCLQIYDAWALNQPRLNLVDVR